MDMRSLGLILVCLALGAGCGNANSNNGNDMGVGTDQGGTPDQAVSVTMTIAQARSMNLTTPFTTTAVVTAVRGDDPMDTKEWYLQDPAGGPNSGIDVYCNKTAKSNPCSMSITAPALHDLVQVTGVLSPYKGKVELHPTASMTMQTNAPLPPIPTLAASDLDPAGSSMYRGVLVKLSGPLTVDSVTPPALYDTKCSTSDAGEGPGGMALCAGCAPPTYSGFQAHDGAGHEVLIENYFYTSEHLQSSPECHTQMGAIVVTSGQTFSSMQGILDFDANAMKQVLSPVVDGDYATP
jgi:hypothetical protein